MESIKFLIQILLIILILFSCVQKQIPLIGSWEGDNDGIEHGIHIKNSNNGELSVEHVLNGFSFEKKYFKPEQRIFWNTSIGQISLRFRNDGKLLLFIRKFNGKCSTALLHPAGL